MRQICYLFLCEYIKENVNDNTISQLDRKMSTKSFFLSRSHIKY